MRIPIIAAIISIILGAILVSITLSVNGYVKMTLPSHLPTGSAITMNGSSTPSNATHVNCQVAIIINNQSYQAVTPTGKNIKGNSSDYSTWTFLSGPVIKPGDNRVTAKYTCFPPTGNNTSVPNFVYHHSMNITSP